MDEPENNEIREPHFSHHRGDYSDSSDGGRRADDHNHARKDDDRSKSTATAFEIEVTGKLAQLCDGIDRLNQITLGRDGLQGEVQSIQKDLAGRNSGQWFQKVLIGLCSGLLGVTMTLLVYASKVAIIETKMDMVMSNQAIVKDTLDKHSISLQRLITKEEIDHPHGSQ